jgi:16S rRNA (uracil1498-N3)-methyltransferase
VRLTRVFVPGPLAGRASVELAGTAANHVVRVLRLRAGDAVTLFDGRGGEYAAKIDQVRRDIVLVQLVEHRAVERESPLAITLAQGISRGERMDLVLQKATELGVRRIVPVCTERSVVRLDEAQGARKLQHWRAVVAAACEQCGRNRLPELDAPTALHALLAEPPGEGLRILLSPRGDLRLADLTEVGSGVTVLIGPEGGLTEDEGRLAVQRGYRAMRFGPRILRTETAALAAVTALQQRFGDL